MKHRRKKQASEGNASGSASAPSATGINRWKSWSFRLVALAGAPIVFLALLELALRIAGYGYPTSFLLPSSSNGQETLVQNNQFGWRFFGAELARRPHPLSVSRAKPPGTIRILVLGESAAKGDPDPRFGFPRLLEATLSLRHPGVRFEVVNAAMTAINSHAILPIARDCTKLDCDVWVVYMGNNEVVGPFGAGTVFGAQSLPLPLIRSALALKTTRSGQLIEALIGRLRTTSQVKQEWGGMEMFVNQQVRADALQMTGVYDHFAENLTDILEAGRRHGVGIVVSTIGVNLRDCSPFSSEHAAGLSATDRARWDEYFERGRKAQQAGDSRTAAESFREAAKVDETFAELRFRQGPCALALGEVTEAQQHFRAACNQDTLRFRCDTRLNEITRKVSSNRELERIRLADAERAFEEASAHGLPGATQFYEHVHLTFEGNCLLARVVAEQIEPLLAEPLRTTTNSAVAWPAPAECANRLGWSDYWRWAGWKGILPRLKRPPFTRQFDHELRMLRVLDSVNKLSSVNSKVGISNALQVCERALAVAPDDWALLTESASLRRAMGDLAGAAAASRRALDMVPSDGETWSQLGLLLARQQQFTNAIEAFRRALALDSLDVISRDGLAQALSASGQQEEAVHEFHRLLADKPTLGAVWLHLGQTLEAMGRKAEADESFGKALANSGQNLPGLIELGGLCQSRGWHEAAATNYIAAIELDPADARLHVGAGQNFAAIGRLDAAVRHSAEAVRLEPEFAEAHLLHGTILGKRGEIAAATEEFRTALQLKPTLLDARINLGIAMRERNPTEAVAQFQEVQRQSPSNATALKYLKELQRLKSAPLHN